jgi:hypothetical protein
MEIYSLSDLNQLPPFMLQTGSGAATNLAYRVDWKQCQPQEGVEDWTLIDSALAAAQAVSTKLSISVKSGIGTPDWVYDVAGAEKFSFVSGASYAPGRQYMPVPWDVKYLERYRQLIAALGQRYGSEPTVDHYALCGMNSITQETLLPHTIDDERNWTNIGYTPDKIKFAWRQLVEFWTNNSQLKIAGMYGPGFFPFNPPDLGYALMNMVVEFAPRRVISMNNGLSAAWMWEAIPPLADQCDIAFQMLGGAGPSIVRALEDAEAVGAQFVEVYPHDLRWL